MKRFDHLFHRMTQRRMGAIVAATALSGALALPAWAQSAGTPPATPAASSAKAECGPQRMHGHHHKRHGSAGGHHARSEADRAQHHAARMEHLKTLLQLQPAQQAAWEKYVAALQPQARPTQADSANAKPLRDMTTPERIELRQQLRKARDAAAQQRDNATKAFYASLTPQQQKAFDALHHAGPGKHGKHGARNPHDAHGKHGKYHDQKARHPGHPAGHGEGKAPATHQRSTPPASSATQPQG